MSESSQLLQLVVVAFVVVVGPVVVVAKPHSHFALAYTFFSARHRRYSALSPQLDQSAAVCNHGCTRHGKCHIYFLNRFL